MLYFVVGKEPNQQEYAWHVGAGIPRIASVDHIYADGHELEHLQSLGFAVDNVNGNVKLYGDRANAALRAMRVVRRADLQDSHTQARPITQR